MILVDSSVWIDHLHRGDLRLGRLLQLRQVLGHPLVIGELACGHLRNRREVLLRLARLPQPRLATHEEALRLIQNYSLMGRGIGYIDVHLLASTLLHPGGQFWTRDRRLRAIANDLHVAVDDDRPSSDQ